MTLGRRRVFVRCQTDHPIHDFFLGDMQACLVEVLEGIVTALMPGVLAIFLFNPLMDGLGVVGAHGFNVQIYV
jgi:hypothetical protein